MRREELLQRGGQGGVVEVGGTREELVAHVAAGCGGEVEHLPRGAFKAGTRASRTSCSERGSAASGSPATRAASSSSAKYGLPSARPWTHSASVAPPCPRAGNRADLERGVLGRQRASSSRSTRALVASSASSARSGAWHRRVVRAQRHDEQQPLVAQVAREEAQQVLRRVVGPVEVLDAADGRRRLGEAPERPQQQLEQPRGRLRGGGAAAAVAQLGAQRRELVAEVVTAQGGHDRRVRQLAGLQRHALAPQDAMPARVGAAGELAGHPRLADPGLARDEHELRPALGGLRQRSVEGCLRVRAADRQRARDTARHMTIIARPPGAGQAGGQRAKRAARRARTRGARRGSRACRRASRTVRAAVARSRASVWRMVVSCWERRESMSTSWGWGEDDASSGAALAHRQNCRTGPSNLDTTVLGFGARMDALTINEAAETTGWSPRMLRYVERVGLVEPARSESGYRLYGPAELQRLRTLRELLAEHDIGLSDLAFALRLRSDDRLRSATDDWLEARGRAPGARPRPRTGCAGSRRSTSACSPHTTPLTEVA